MRRIIEGNTASGKTTDAISRYNRMLSDKISSNEILVLVANRWEKLRWQREVKYRRAGSLNIYSYFGFVQKEIRVYWPMILEKCDLIKKKSLLPVIMHYEASQSLMYKTVEYYRRKGYLDGIIGEDEGIARKLLSNIVSAALSNTNYRRMGERIYASKPEEGRFSKKFYDEMNEIVNRYIERTLEEGIIDQAAAIYLYSNYLMKDERYISHLKNRYKFLMVDDLELSSISQTDFILNLCQWMRGVILYKNTDGPHGIYQFSKNYLEENLVPLFQKEKLVNQCEGAFDKFLEDFREGLFLERGEAKGYSNIHLDIDNEYKSKTDRKILRLVKNLLEEGVDPREISVVVPRYDVTLDFGLGRIARDHNIRYLYTSKNDKITDNPRVFSLIVLSVLFYRFKNIHLNYDEIKSFLAQVLGINMISASILTDYLSERNYTIKRIERKGEVRGVAQEIIEGLNKVADFIETTPKDIPIDKFFLGVYMEFLLAEEDNSEDIKACKSLIDSARSFLEVMENFGMISDANYEFVKFIRDGAKTTETLDDIGEKLEGNFLSLSTPNSFIGTKRRSRYLIMGEIRNPLYTLKTYNEFQNLWALNKDWRGEVLTGEMEVQKEREELFSVVSRLLRSCEEVYIYGTLFSNKGFEQWSLLSGAIDRIVADN
ncbi:hypothetical protein PM10SUCC1_07910 [Propionigenium maris DSM 9537]|uniref:UvrD-like helicase ATP-binding domain-containing protein n=1 Tax=Propionigenium maris DSM 9537 TaxID=1123000 RepID=A0A9W6LM40_9FUSO|nr:UvrD-helicase domain-containing protein [Propionigenium maris]GLI55277.1 hypothetical protein PM10SUCC1_07910 [Propionigenium maris DSM 9537]